MEVLFSDSAGFVQRLPREEIEFVHSARIDLLVPITLGSGRIGALLALGIKRSEEPYSREDQELLEAIASSLAHLIGLPEPASEQTASMFEECPQCGTCYETTSGTCTIEGAFDTCAAYETLTGSKPFTATSAADWRRAVLAGSFTPLSQHLMTSQVNGQAFFETCFATDRSKRPGSVTEFLHRVEEAFA